MVAVVQNCTVSQFRGTTTNRFGDVQQAKGQPLAQHVPASVMETTSVVMDPATQTPQTVRTSVALVPSWTGFVNSDRLLDETTGDLYIVEEVISPPNFTGIPADLRLILRRTSAAGT